MPVAVRLKPGGVPSNGGSPHTMIGNGGHVEYQRMMIFL